MKDLLFVIGPLIGERKMKSFWTNLAEKGCRAKSVYLCDFHPDVLFNPQSGHPKFRHLIDGINSSRVVILAVPKQFLPSFYAMQSILEALPAEIFKGKLLMPVFSPAEENEDIPEKIMRLISRFHETIIIEESR
ncbi:hypothetical protein [Metabacillus hrfriensis]|uniref:Uncharacterized protein n=1 Tax=Metabacillus hrfriensis TaxID=3048891 RepID=A0ACD4RFT6_9BACI|nr:hypothetical protein [Metabacillus sp. CT-WN-B3]WHZ59247.1 hypothetical protein QLQ22_07950 [Metabacillus sp. CT-WN-B3]